MTWTRAVVTIPKLTGLPEDAAQNILHFDNVADAGTLSDLTTHIGSFYGTDTAGADTAVGDLFSPTVSRATNACTIDYYEVPAVEGPVGSPIGSGTFTLPALLAGVTALPDEIAVCLTIHGDLASVPESVPGGPAGPAGDTKPRARRRGRLYLGPLSSACIASVGGQTNPPFVGSAARTDIKNAAIRLVEDSAEDNWIWKVFSRTSWSMHTVQGGWIDNAPDVQRRRGLAATARTTFDLS